MTDGVDVVLDVVVIRVTLLVMFAIVVVDVDVVPEWEPNLNCWSQLADIWSQLADICCTEGPKCVESLSSD